MRRREEERKGEEIGEYFEYLEGDLEMENVLIGSWKWLLIDSI